jgi:hypothetical protein
MNVDYEQSLQNLIAAGVPEAVAVSMLNSMMKAEAKPVRKPGQYRSNSNPKIEAVVLHENTCQTCGCIVTHRVVAKVYEDEADIVVKGKCGICSNCPKYLETLSKDELIALFVIQNHPEVDLRMLSTEHQIKLAKTRPATHWIGTKFTRQDMSKPERQEK